MYERRVLDKEILPSRVTWLCKNSKTSGFLGTWSWRKRKQSIGGRKMVGMEWKVELFKLCASAWASTKSRTIPVPIESVSKYFEAYCNVDRIPCKSLDCAYQFPLMYLLKFPSVMSQKILAVMFSSVGEYAGAGGAILSLAETLPQLQPHLTWNIQRSFNNNLHQLVIESSHSSQFWLCTSSLPFHKSFVPENPISDAKRFPKHFCAIPP